MEKLVTTANKLQAISSQANIQFNLNLPQIVVVGTQSSGKSSVLESIISGDFLPCGSGIVTRTPLNLQLRDIEPGSEYALFSHQPNKRYTDFTEIREEIKRRTIELAGNNLGISKVPITLTLFSASILNLTFVDLPGITNIPEEAQPKDIDIVVRDLALSYIKNPNTIILAILPANVDLATSDSLNLVRKVDPKGERTIGVLTKLDLMNKGTNVLEVLEGKKHPLRLGYVGVVCRSQEDIKQSVTIEKALRNEEDFFNSHKEYAKLNCGTECLTKKLNEVLTTRITQCLLILKQGIESQLRKKQIEFGSYGFIPKDSKSLNMLLVKLVGEYSKYLEDSIEESSNPIMSGIGTGARLNLLFNEVYVNSLTSISPLEDFKEVDIRTAILNANALRPNLFIPESAFEMLVKMEIERCLKPSLCCALQVYGELEYTAMYPEITELSRFKKLQEVITGIVKEVLQENLEKTNEKIRNLIDSEKGCINLEHPDVLTGTTAVLSMMKDSKLSSEEYKEFNELMTNEQLKHLVISPNSAPNMEIQLLEADQKKEVVKMEALPEVLRAKDEATPKENLELHIIRKLVKSYFKVAIIRIANVVPKIIVNFLVEKTINEIKLILLNKIIKREDLDKLFEQDPAIAERARLCEENIKVLTKALKELQHIKI